MTTRTFHRYVFCTEVLSEDEIPDGADIDYLITEGDCSGRVISETHEVIDGRTAAKLLMEQGSSPEFFWLTEDGEDTEDR